MAGSMPFSRMGTSSPLRVWSEDATRSIAGTDLFGNRNSLPTPRQGKRLLKLPDLTDVLRSLAQIFVHGVYQDHNDANHQTYDGGYDYDHSTFGEGPAIWRDCGIHDLNQGPLTCFVKFGHLVLSRQDVENSLVVLDSRNLRAYSRPGVWDFAARNKQILLRAVFRAGKLGQLRA